MRAPTQLIVFLLAISVLVFVPGPIAAPQRQGTCMRKWLKLSGMPHNVNSNYEDSLLTIQLDESSIGGPMPRRFIPIAFGHRTHAQQFLECITRQTENCSQNPPCHTGVCLFNRASNSFRCKCPNTSSGDFCEKDVDECQLGLHTCSLLTSTCINKNDGYTCECQPGFSKRGQLCEDINECLSTPPPCGKTAMRCKNLLNDFRCLCKPGYTGRRCEKDFDECSSSPCQNGGTCYNKVNHFTCKCPIEFEGTMCEKRWFSSALFRSIEQKLNGLSSVAMQLQTNQENVQHHLKEMEKQHHLLALTEGTYVRILRSCQQLENNLSSTLHLQSYSFKVFIDPDGNGSVQAFPVICTWNKTARKFIATVHHNLHARTRVKGFEGSGSYRADITYDDASPAQVSALVDASANCRQWVKYECYDSTLTYGYWRDRNGQIMRQWAGHSLRPGVHSCACGLSNTCQGSGKKCNCDINDATWRKDEGYITDKKHLPITTVHFGDTANGEEEGYHTIGPLICTT